MQNGRTNRFRDKFDEMVRNLCQPFEQQIARCLSQPHTSSCAPQKDAFDACLSYKRSQLIKKQRQGRLQRFKSQPKPGKLQEQCGGLGPCLLKKSTDDENEQLEEGKPFTFRAYGMSRAEEAT